MAALGRLLGATGLGALALTPEESEAAFGGVLAKTADKAMLKLAQQMKERGFSRDDIWEQTGWFQGVDDKWRFEIDDSQMRITDDIEYMPTYDTWGDTFRGRLQGRRLLPYQHAFSNPNLEEAYENLPSVGLFDHPTATGGYSPRSNAIGIRPDLPTDEAVTVGAHEGQHAIQRLEGFATGGSPKDFQQQEKAELARDALSWARELRRKREEMPDADISAVENKLIEQYQEIGAMDWLPSREARDIATQPYVLFPEQYPGRSDFLQELVELYGLDKKVTPSSSRDLYKRLAGEVEARNVQTRLDMTPEERRMMPPWLTEDVPQSQQIVSQSGYANPALLGVLGAGTGAGILAAPEATEGTISAPIHPNLFNAVNRARTFGQRLEGSPMSLLYPEGTVNWLGRLSMGQTPTWGERIGAAFDWF